jgi:hypothetical protein
LPFRQCCARHSHLAGLVVVLVLLTMFVPSEAEFERVLKIAYKVLRTFRLDYWSGFG